jgi:small-conductance mechanosensitive channel
MNELMKTEIISFGSFTLTVGHVLMASLIFISAYVFIQLLSVVIKRSFRSRGKPDARHISIIQLVRYFVWTIAFVFILQSLGINITFLIASSAALLVGIGLGLQNVFKDFISGITILAEGTINVNDVVEVDGLVVKVNEISFRTSIVTTRDDNVVIIPNHKFVEEKIVNWTNNKLPTRFIIEVGVEYDSDLNLVEKILIDAAVADTDVLTDPEYHPSVRLRNFGDSALEFQLIFFSFKLFRIEKVKSRLRFQIVEAFRRNNVTIPFPQRVLHQTKSS